MQQDKNQAKSADQDDEGGDRERRDEGTRDQGSTDAGDREGTRGPGGGGTEQSYRRGGAGQGQTGGGPGNVGNKQ